MADPAAKAPMTYDEYLAFERASDTRHEFANGEIFAMAGGTDEHSQLSQRVSMRLGVALEGGPCVVYNSDMRVRTADDVAAYPDVTVVCGERTYSTKTKDELTNPRVIVEVLSDSTEAYDRGEKFVHYRSTPSVAEVLFVATKHARIEHYVRRDDGVWALRVAVPGDTVRFESIDATLDVARIYAGLVAAT